MTLKAGDGYTRINVKRACETRRDTMEKEKAYLVIHPKAERYIAGVVDVLEERWDVTQLVTEYTGHGMVAAHKAPEQGYRWVIVLGGDGTLNEVVNGVAKAQGC